MNYEREYGIATTVFGVVIDTGAADFKGNPNRVAGDFKISKDGGTFIDLSTLPVVDPTGSVVIKYALSATEMQAITIIITSIDADGEWEDNAIIIETYGHASARHKFNRNIPHEEMLAGIGTSVGASLPFAADTDNVLGDIKSIAFVGVQTLNTFAKTKALDGVLHVLDDTTNTIDIVYGFSIGGGRTATSFTFKGFLNGANDIFLIQAYNFVLSAWETRGTIVGKALSTNDTISEALLTEHTGTGSDLGKVYLRILGTETNPTLSVDELLIGAVSTGSNTGYANGSIYVDTENGIAGTQVGFNGVADRPCLTWADALTISTGTGLVRFVFSAASSVQLTAVSDAYEFSGHEYTVDLNGKSISGAFFDGAIIVGSDSGSNANEVDYRICSFTNSSLGNHHMNDCQFGGTITITEAGIYDYVRCHSHVAGTGTPVLDTGASVANVDIGFRGYSGGIDVRNMGQVGTDNMTIEGVGQIIINANCVPGGTIVIRGHFGKTDNGTCTVVDRDNFESILDDGVGSTYDRTTDSLQELRDLLVPILIDTDDIQEHLPAGFMSEQTDVAAIQADLDNETDGLGALLTAIGAGGGGGASNGSVSARSVRTALPGDIVPLIAFLSIDGAAVTGETVAVSIQRASDNRWWSGQVWTPIYVTVPMVEQVGNVAVEGEYRHNFKVPVTPTIDRFLWSVKTGESTPQYVKGEIHTGGFNIGAIAGSTAAADSLGAAAGTVVRGTVVNGTLSLTEMTTNLTEKTSNHYRGRQCVWVTGRLEDQQSEVLSYSGILKSMIFRQVTDIPQVGDRFILV